MSDYVSFVRQGEGRVEEICFENLREGDIFFVDGIPYTVGVDAHYSGDASYDGYLLYDTSENGWFPEDLDADVGPILLRNLTKGDKVLVEGDSAELWISDYNIRVSSYATVEQTPRVRDKKVLVTIDNIDGDSKVTVYVRRSRLCRVFEGGH